MHPTHISASRMLHVLLAFCEDSQGKYFDTITLENAVQEKREKKRKKEEQET